jgi:ribosome-binding protein aMBF1 (putative translation factor)
MSAMCHYWRVPDLTQTAADPWSYLVRMQDTAGDRDVTFGALVRSAREAKGWTQDELAEESGISRTTISRWEN